MVVATRFLLIACIILAGVLLLIDQVEPKPLEKSEDLPSSSNNINLRQAVAENTVDSDKTKGNQSDSNSPTSSSPPTKTLKVSSSKSLLSEPVVSSKRIALKGFANSNESIVPTESPAVSKPNMLVELMSITSTASDTLASSDGTTASNESTVSDNTTVVTTTSSSLGSSTSGSLNTLSTNSTVQFTDNPDSQIGEISAGSSAGLGTSVALVALLAIGVC